MAGTGTLGTKDLRIVKFDSKKVKRRWSAAEKEAIIRESFSATSSVVSVARKHGVSPVLLYAWRRAWKLAGTKPKQSSKPIEFMELHAAAGSQDLAPVSLLLT